MDIQKEIVRITSEYFEDDLDYLKLLKASNDYKSILIQNCGQDIDNEYGRKDIRFENGKALGTFWAALCLDDLLRTRQFIRGINLAIKEKINSHKTLQILYAGTGPFATLILPHIFRYPKQDIKYTFLEINPYSFQILQNLISKLGLEEYDITSLNEDATKYQIDSNNVPDIIISETMQSALVNEQQVPIFLNLMSQVENDSIFIPEKIELFIGLKKAGVPAEDLQAKHFHKYNKVLEVSKESMFPSKKFEKQILIENSFPKMQTVIENANLKGFNQLLLITEIQVYKDEKISNNECSLTIPVIIGNVPDNLQGSISIDTQYIISSEPKLEYNITLVNIM